MNRRIIVRAASGELEPARSPKIENIPRLDSSTITHNKNLHRPAAIQRNVSSAAVHPSAAVHRSAPRFPSMGEMYQHGLIKDR